MNTFPRLTPLEQEILNHRLDVPDAIADALPEYSNVDVADVADFLLASEVDKARAINEQLMYDVLADAVSGSVYLGASSEESEMKQSTIARAGNSLARKISAYIGRKVEFPAC